MTKIIICKNHYTANEYIKRHFSDFFPNPVKIVTRKSDIYGALDVDAIVLLDCLPYEYDEILEYAKSHNVKIKGVNSND